MTRRMCISNTDIMGILTCLQTQREHYNSMPRREGDSQGYSKRHSSQGDPPWYGYLPSFTSFGLIALVLQLNSTSLSADTPRTTTIWSAWIS